MQFGKINPSTLDQAKLVLPPDPAATAKILALGKTTTPTEIRVGCTGWGLAAWVGKIYPKGTKPANFLNEYGKQFNCIEFNGTYYKLPAIEQVKTWRQKVGNDFKFCPKFTNTITHEKYLKNVQAEVNAFLEVCEAFGKNLGPVFLMPHPQMGPAEMDTILQFIDALPSELEVFTEFRHPEMFKSPYFDEVFNAMEKRQYGTVITDAAGRRDCVHMRLTTPEAFIRFVGNGLHPSDYQRIDEWVLRIGQWMQHGLKKCYFFMHQHEEVHAPELCKYFIEQLNAKFNTGVKVPRLVEDQELRLF